MQPQAYIHSHTHHAMLDAIEQIVADHDPNDAYDVSMLRTRLFQALGEVGGIWPASVYQGDDDPAGPSIMVTA